MISILLFFHLSCEVLVPCEGHSVQVLCELAAWRSMKRLLRTPLVSLGLGVHDQKSGADTVHCDSFLSAN